MPRGTKLTPKLGKQIVDLIKQGSYANAAAQACGVSESTYYEWLRQGEKAVDGIFRLFYEEVQKAQAVPEVKVTNALYQNALGGDTRAQIEFLSRRYKKRWGNQPEEKAAEPSGQAQAQIRFYLPENGRE